MGRTRSSLANGFSKERPSCCLRDGGTRGWHVMQRRQQLRRLLLGLGVAAAVLLPTLVAVGAPVHWSQRALELLRARGFAVNAAAPDAPVSRAEVAQLLVGAVGLAGDAQELREQPSRFYDVSKGTAAANIELAAEVGVMQGYGGGAFGPGDPLTRAQLVAVLVRALGWEDRAQAAMSADLTFKDAGDIPAWARGYVAVASSEQLVLGYEDGTFRPNQPVSQGDTAALIARFMAGRGSLFQRQGALSAVPGGGRIIIGGETLRLTKDAAAYRNGAAVPLSSLQAGDQVQAVLSDAGQVSYVQVVVYSAAGALVSLNVGERQVQVLGGAGVPVSLTVLPTASIFRNGRPAALMDLRYQDQIYALLDGAGKVKGLDATHFDFDGTLVAPGGSGGQPLAAVSQGRPFQAPVSSSVVVYLNQQPAQLADLRPSDHVDVALDGSGAVIYLEAKR